MSANFLNVLSKLGHWMYQVTNIYIPGLGVTAWMLGLTLLTISFLFKIFDVFTHRNSGMESNNNSIVRGDD